MSSTRQWQWIGLSVALLVIYLAFFHFCLNSSYAACNWLGIAFWLGWLAVCFSFRSLFKNRFEFWIHQIVGLDILLEGFNPFHDGLGFYACALCFWSVLLLYHFVSFKKPVIGFESLLPETADSGS